MQWTSTFLRSKVARRIFLLFVSCALLPITILAAVSFYQVSQQLQNESRRQLMEMSESQGMLIDERLQSLDGDLQLIAWQSKGDRLPDLREPLNSHFSALAMVNEEGSRIDNWGAPISFQGPSQDEATYLRSGKALLRSHPCATGMGTCVSLVRAMDPTGRRFLVSEVNPDYLWVRQHLPAGFEACVHTASGEALFCSDPEVILATASLGQGHRSSGFFQADANHTLYDSAYWTLLLRPGFHAESWIIAVGEKHDDIVMPIRRFRNSFPMVALLALWVVTLFSSVQIRRTLVPLEKLEEGTRQIGQQHFEQRVEVHSGDEFETLAQSFNSMSLQLGRQFHALKTINEIDQAIFASLNREGIVDAVLDHMPFLLPCDCFAVAIFNDENSSGTLRFRNAQGRGIRRTISSALLSTTDSKQLQENPASLLVNREHAPAFLQPLCETGMTSFLVLPIFVDKAIFGALISARGTALQLPAEDVQQARQVADQLAVAFSNVQLIDAMEQLHWGTLTALARAIDAKSAWTAGHSERVTALALRIGRAMGLPAKDLRIMQRGGLLHDVGKIGTPPTILDKAGRLDGEETQVMQDHVRIGVRILEPIAAFREALPIVAQHHEWFDGSGYPNHLAGEQISLHSRIFAVADVFDALTSDRPYRKGVPRPQALQMIREKSGAQFDPQVVEVFMRMCAEQEQPSAPASSPGRSQAAAAGQGS
jgi:putative nucleotidyltransferase with HDIG domain